jgi:diguanylate cyclase (GGDEF)-like protein
MSGRIRRAIEEALANADALRREAYIDPLTSLFNRRGFEHQLQSLIQSTADVYSCALALVEIRNFADFNTKVGYRRGDEVIAVLAGTLAAACGGHATVCARLGGAGFAMVAINVDEVSLRELVAGVCHHIRRALSEQGLDSELHFDCGATYREGAIPDLTELLASADQAVAQARAMGDNEFAIASFDQTVSDGSQAWRKYIERCVGEGAIALFTQEVFGLSDRQLEHLEVTVRLLRPDSAPLEAAQFLPMAVRHGLIGRLDCLVVEKLLDYLSSTPGATLVALNVAARTIADPEAARHLLALLDAKRNLASRLTFEMTEFGAMQDLELTQRFCGEVRRRGARFALDNFSMRQDSLKLVHALRPQYIKLSVGYSREIAHSMDCRFLVTSIARAVEPLGIRIFAQAVEDQGLVTLLAELGLSGYQGYAASRPTQIS